MPVQIVWDYCELLLPSAVIIIDDSFEYLVPSEND